jgi:hypothetical protein
MALILGLKKGRSFEILDSRFTVSKIKSAKLVVLEEEDTVTGETRFVSVEDSKKLEVLPDVTLTLGLPKFRNEAIILITAPKHIKIHKCKSWRASSEARKAWRKSFPSLSMDTMLELVSESVSVGLTRRMYGSLMFEVSKNKCVTRVWVPGGVDICEYCFDTGLVKQWDDLEKRTHKVPCSCGRKRITHKKRR